jgi:nicotinamidase-related amidase
MLPRLSGSGHRQHHSKSNAPRTIRSGHPADKDEGRRGTGLSRTEWKGIAVVRGLLIIDIQNDYFPGGAMPLVGPEAAADVAGALLEQFRQDGEPVIHIQHVWDEESATFMRPGTPGVEIHASVRPRPGEPVIVKAYPNSFRETSLGETLTAGGIDELVVAGMMTSMCVDATVRAANDLGYQVTVVADACAAPDLEFDGRQVPGADVHAAFLAALSDGYANVIKAKELTG